MLKRIITALLCLLIAAFYAAQTTSAQKNEAAVKPAIAKSLPLLESIRVPFLEQTGITTRCLQWRRGWHANAASKPTRKSHAQSRNRF
jgi:hypothetical protein